MLRIAVTVKLITLCFNYLVTKSCHQDEGWEMSWKMIKACNWLGNRKCSKHGSRLMSATHRPTAKFGFASPHLCHTPFGDPARLKELRARAKTYGWQQWKEQVLQKRKAPVQQWAGGSCKMRLENENPRIPVSWGLQIATRKSVKADVIRAVLDALGAVSGATLVRTLTLKVLLLGRAWFALCLISGREELLYQNLALQSMWCRTNLGDTHQEPCPTQEFGVKFLLRQLSEVLQPAWNAIWCLKWS